jgi:hypothetical protein
MPSELVISLAVLSIADEGSSMGMRGLKGGVNAFTASSNVMSRYSFRSTGVWKGLVSSIRENFGAMYVRSDSEESELPANDALSLSDNSPSVRGS